MTTYTRIKVPYGRIDRLLHRLAFSHPGPQLALSDLEDLIYRDRIVAGSSRRPVLITSLPRAGTTILLQTLAALPEFASATYRHMPFTLLPLLWGSITGRLHQEGRMRERAHGDGIAVDFDSPEAFEEPVWMAFWHNHYQGGYIRTWSRLDANPEFEAFFRQYMRKVVAAGGGRRYLSKNNTNVARLGLLERLFPDALIVVPIRDPWAQAASLLRQHLRFLDVQKDAAFAQRYMRDLGHFEFGEALRPIAFDGRVPETLLASEMDYWLQYWEAGYSHVLAEASDKVIFVDHDALSADPEAHLTALSVALGLATPETLIAAAKRYRPSPPGSRAATTPALARRLAELHRALKARCLPRSERVALGTDSTAHRYPT